jgi:hypothetical protein
MVWSARLALPIQRETVNSRKLTQTSTPGGSSVLHLFPLSVNDYPAINTRFTLHYVFLSVFCLLPFDGYLSPLHISISFPVAHADIVYM